MINLRNITDTQLLRIPLEEPAGVMPYTLTLRSTFDEVTIAPTWVSDELSEFGHYVEVVAQLPEDLPDGSYEYDLTDSQGRKVAGGCVHIGDYDDTAESYEKSISYEQTF
jgi:hypothetical protein